MKFFRIFEIVYLIVAVLSAIEVYSTWNTDRNRAYLFLLFFVGALFMYFFRRRYRQKFEQRKKDN